MRSLSRVGLQPVSLPLAADDIVEFHAARLLLLMEICGVKGRIDGLTKMAKLDFFSRYPDFFEVARAAVAPATPDASVRGGSGRRLKTVKDPAGNLGQPKREYA